MYSSDYVNNLKERRLPCHATPNTTAVKKRTHASGRLAAAQRLRWPEPRTCLSETIMAAVYM